MVGGLVRRDLHLTEEQWDGLVATGSALDVTGPGQYRVPFTLDVIARHGGGERGASFPPGPATSRAEPVAELQAVPLVLRQVQVPAVYFPDHVRQLPTNNNCVQLRPAGPFRVGLSEPEPWPGSLPMGPVAQDAVKHGSVRGRGPVVRENGHRCLLALWSLSVQLFGQGER